MQSDRRPLIVHVVHGFAVGGLENGVVNLINSLPATQWRHAILALSEIDPTFVQRLTRSDVELIALRKRPGHLVSYYPELFKIFRRLRPAIVHTRNLAALEAAVPALLARVPVRIHGEHGWDVGDLGGTSRKYQWVRRLYAPAITHWIAMSRDLETYLHDRVGVDRRRVSQIYNGVNLERFSGRLSPQSSSDECPFADSDCWTVGTVGRMQTVKNQTLLVQAFIVAVQRSAAARQRMRLVVVGDGPLRAVSKEMLADAGLSQLAWLPGERSDVSAQLARMNCFVLPSLAEGISNTILEAMASGLPVIATRVGGNVELVEDGVTGVLVPPSDPELLATAMLRLFEDPALGQQQGVQGRATVERRFALGRMVEDYRLLYERLVEGSSKGHGACAAS